MRTTTTTDASLRERIGRLLGGRVVGLRPTTGGYTTALRAVVTLDSGRSAFVKTSAELRLADWIRTEARHYDALVGADFLPELLAFDDDGTAPLLVLEDLGGAHWPPPWSPARVDAVLSALEQVRGAAARMPPNLGTLEDERDFLNRWGAVAADPAPFLSLGFCSAGWLERALPDLLAAQDAAVLTGDDLLHLDVRSDNLCLRPDGRAALVDWNWACRGNADFDLAAWAPSLHAEGGPPPEAILPEGAGAFASALAGFWAQSAGLPPPATAPHVRTVQKRQLTVALPWAARALGLPPPDGNLAFL